MQLETVRELFDANQEQGNQLEALVYSAVYLKVFLLHLIVGLFYF